MEDTKSKILDIAEDLIMTRGYNGFSYNDISEIIGIRKASIHYHFKTKADLVSAVLIRYKEGFSKWCENQKGKTIEQKLDAYGKLYKFLSDKGTKICPIDLLSAEYPTLPVKIQKNLKAMIEDEKRWLVDVLESERINKKQLGDVDPGMIAEIIQASIAWAMKNGRIFKNNDLIYGVNAELKKLLLK